MNEIRLPEAFLSQMKLQLGTEYEDFLCTYHTPGYRGLRLRNCDTVKPADVGEKIPWAENGFYIPAESEDGAGILHEAGAFYIQEPSAMAAATALHPLPGERVLDLCAAPGGKSTQLAAQMQGMGTLICNEPHPARAQILSRNIERMGVPHAVVTCAYPEELSIKWARFFDRILVDAPCSGEGMFRKSPETRLEWTQDAPEKCAKRQQMILDHAADMLAPGGLLAYSTCTFNRTENEGVIEHFLASHPIFSLESFSLPTLDACDGCMHLWPHQIAGEGHFVALLRNRDTSGKQAKGTALKALDAETISNVTDALREILAIPPMPNARFGDTFLHVPPVLPDLNGIKVLRMGLQLGSYKGKVFIPDHALALSEKAISVYALSEKDARAYQHGEVLPYEENLKGFICPTYQGMQLGWSKASQGQLKNHYPKGLRK